MIIIHVTFTNNSVLRRDRIRFSLPFATIRVSTRFHITLSYSYYTYGVTPFGDVRRRAPSSSARTERVRCTTCTCHICCRFTAFPAAADRSIFRFITSADREVPFVRGEIRLKRSAFPPPPPPPVIGRLLRGGCATTAEKTCARTKRALKQSRSTGTS